MSEARHSLASRPPSAAVSDAINTLNRLGYVVNADGWIEVDGIPVQLVVRGGNVIAEAQGVTMPFRLLATTLKPVARRSFPPRRVGKDGVPSWAEGPDVVPDRKDMRVA